jgi:hypothetical protein
MAQVVMLLPMVMIRLLMMLLQPHLPLLPISNRRTRQATSTESSNPDLNARSA